MKKKVFLIGIDGIGVSALAKFLAAQNYQIFGSDFQKGENAQELEKKYDLVFLTEGNIKTFEKNNFEFLVYTPAVNIKKHKIVQLAIKKNIPIYSYPEYLGKISRDKFTIAIAGTNGKTTTSTMLTETMEFLGLKPTAIVGGIMKKFNSNFLAGKSDILILESCEYKNSFLNLQPDIIVITNITPDHLDFFETAKKYEQVFVDFIKNIKENGILVCNLNDFNLKKVILKAEERNLKIIDYTKFIKNLNLKIAGQYNRENAAVVLAIISELKLIKKNVLKTSKKYLENDFVGTKRRLEFIGKTESGAEIYDDYAHNPEAIEVLISGLKQKYSQITPPGGVIKKIVVIFQPHLYSRTKDFQNEFAQVLSLADEIFLLPIYASREKKDLEISSEILAKKIKNKNVQICQNLDDCIQKIKKQKYNENTIIITVGAGDVYKIGKKLIK